MLLATPANFRANYGAEETANCTRLYMEAHAPAEMPDEEGEEEAARTEEEVLAWALTRASSRAASYLAVRYPAFRGEDVPVGDMPAALVNAVCDIARYYLTGTPVQETDPIAERYKDALSWLREIAAGLSSLPGPWDDGGEDDPALSGDVVFTSSERRWSGEL